jgi:hypothetical protein
MNRDCQDCGVADHAPCTCDQDYPDGEPDPTPEMCPMCCGRTTEDVYGGPCQTCWNDSP